MSMLAPDSLTHFVAPLIQRGSFAPLILITNFAPRNPPGADSSGRSAARLAHHVRDVGVGCSNHLAPTDTLMNLQKAHKQYVL